MAQAAAATAEAAIEGITSTATSRTRCPSVSPIVASRAVVSSRSAAPSASSSSITARASAAA